MGTMGDWLIGQFSIFGIQFQNWMLVALAIALGAIVYARFTHGGR